MKRMLQYLKPYWGSMILAMLIITVSTFCDLLLPAIMSNILNLGVYQQDFSYICRCCLYMAVISLVGLLAVLIGSWISTYVVSGFCADVRTEVFQKVNRMSFEEFGAMGTAALVTRATHDVETVSWVAAELSGTAATIPVLFIGGVILAMRKDIWLSLILLAFVPVILAAVVLIGKRILPLWEKSDEYIDRQNDLMRQRLRGIRVIRAFGAESREHERIAEATHTMAKTIIDCNVSMGLITPLASFLLNCAALLIVYIGGWRMESGSSLTGGDVFAIVQYISLVSSGVIMGAFAIIMFPHAKVAADRIGQVLDTKGMADPVARQALELTGNIDFENVSFAYAGAAEKALDGITLHISAGQKIAVIGGTGAGKSTLVSMLLGFRMPTEGRVLLDGMATEDLSRYTMRSNISCVLQNTSIYSGTVRENIAMGKNGASDEEIWKALEVAQAADFVKEFPERLDHEIKQSGKNLSGGQKQRLSIARAVVKNAPIFVFDDSFSALDFLTEARLRSALAKHISGKTQIIITQRVSSAMHCDWVFVMDKGRIVGSGTHRDLLANCGVYQEIHASQTGGAAE